MVYDDSRSSVHKHKKDGGSDAHERVKKMQDTRLHTDEKRQSAENDASSEAVPHHIHT